MESADRAAPFLRWAGSKRQLVPRLAAYWPGGGTRYIEPFVGSACLFFHVAPDSAILGDINPELINTYIAVRDHVAEVASILADLSPGQTEYYMIRALAPERMSLVERACRFIYLNRFCFNGLYRTNQAGQFNVPYGARKSGSLPTRADLLRCSKVLQVAELVVGDFETTVDGAGAGDFVYMDPPFALSNRRSFRQYDPAAFGTDDLLRLRQAMESMASRGARFVVSYAADDEALCHWQGFDVASASVRRNVAGFTASRRRDRELLVSNASTTVHLNWDLT